MSQFFCSVSTKMIIYEGDRIIISVENCLAYITPWLELTKQARTCVKWLNITTILHGNNRENLTANNTNADKNDRKW